MGARVVIVGGGFAGLATARRLAQGGRGCVVLERRSQLATEGAALALQPNGLAALAALGLLEGLRPHCLPISTAVQRDPSGRLLATYRYSELRHPFGWVSAVERARVIELLAGGATVELGCTVTGLVREGGRIRGVRCRDEGGGERELAAHWVVGADGARSRVRDAMGARLVARSGPYRYLLGVSPHVRPDRTATLYLGRGWADGVIPMRSGTDFWDHLTGATDAALARGDFEAWRDAYRRRVPEADALLEGFSSLDELAVLTGRSHRAVPRSVAGAVLAGDAAAAVHPHSGQGANLALADGVALGDALLDGGDEAVRAYSAERDRRLRVAVPYSVLTGRALDAPNLAWRLVRASGYGWARVPPVRRALLARTAGV